MLVVPQVRGRISYHRDDGVSSHRPNHIEQRLSFLLALAYTWPLRTGRLIRHVEYYKVHVHSNDSRMVILFGFALDTQVHRICKELAALQFAPFTFQEYQVYQCI